MKFIFLLTITLTSSLTFAGNTCDVRVGESIGIKVVEFATGNVIHSKMSLKESTAEALQEEMINLQDMGVCKEKIIAQVCVLKLEKKQKTNLITLYRGKDRWLSWLLTSKIHAQNFVKSLKRVGFCS